MHETKEKINLLREWVVLLACNSYSSTNMCSALDTHQAETIITLHRNTIIPSEVDRALKNAPIDYSKKKKYRVWDYKGKLLSLSSFLQALALSLAIFSCSVSHATNNILDADERPFKMRKLSVPSDPLYSSSIQLTTLIDLPDELLVHILTFASTRDLIIWLEVNKKFSALAKEQFPKRVLALCPQYEPDMTKHEVKSPQHLIFLLERFNKPIAYGKLPFLYMEAQFFNLIAASFLTPKALCLKGLIFEMAGLEDEAWSCYSTADKAGQVLAKKKVGDAIYNGDLGQGRLSQQKRFNLLELRGNEGDKNAQVLVNEAIYMGYLGQDRFSPQERFEKLRDRSHRGDTNAQQWINEAIYNGQLGQDRISPQERFRELEAGAKKGDICAQALINGAIYNGELGQDSVSLQKRFNKLEESAKNGYLGSQVFINEAIYSGKLGQGIFSSQERFKKLRERAKAGDINAQSWLIEAIYHGQLGQDSISPQERFVQLNEFALVGDEEALEFVNEAIYHGQLGEDKFSPLERFYKLKMRAEKGDKNAQEWINKSVYYGDLGQDTISPSERFNYLNNRANQGDIHAQEIVIKFFLTYILYNEGIIFSKVVINNYFSFLNFLFFY